jgi:hypothetical protein
MQKTLNDLQPWGGKGTLETVKWWLYIVLVAILIMGGIYVYRHRQDLGLVSPPGNGIAESALTEQTAQATHPATIVWQSVDRTPDGFKVEMPANLKQIKVPAYNEQGSLEQVDMIYSYPDSETCFSVAWADNPPVERINSDEPDRTLDMARDDAMARTQTTLVAQSEISQQGFPGRDFSARNLGGGVINSRLVLARGRLYMLSAAFPSTAARRDQDVARFFNSFSVVAPAKN